MPRDHPAPKAIAKGLAGWQRDVAVRLLREDLAGDRPVAELADRCGLSRSHYTRAFKACMGLPTHRWLIRFRIERAREMLERTGDSIAAIALACGFADQSHLTRVFRAVTGTSPAAWRRRRKALDRQA